MLWIALAATAAIAGPSSLPAYGVGAPRINVLDQVVYAPTGATVPLTSLIVRGLSRLERKGLPNRRKMAAF